MSLSKVNIKMSENYSDDDILLLRRTPSLDSQQANSEIVLLERICVVVRMRKKLSV